jgi:hypothetical protein
MDAALLIIVILLVIAYLAIAAYGAFRPPTKRKDLHLGPASVTEWALVLSSLPVMLVACVVLAIPPIDRLAVQGLSSLLEDVCPAPLPLLWCRAPRPLPWLATVQAVNYLAFLLMSAYFIFRISFGKHQKPSLYIPGSLPTWVYLFGVILWTGLALDMQLFTAKVSPFSYLGLAISMVWLTAGLSSIRALAIATKYRRLTPAKATK